MRRVLAPSGFFLGLLFFAQNGLAAGQSGLTAPAFSLSAADLQAASAAAPADKDFDVQILFEGGHYTIAADGTLKYQHRLIYRVETAASAKSWAEVSSSYDPWYEKPSQIHARVLQINGTFAELDQKTITDAPIKADDAETFSSSHVRRAPLPGMAAGAIVEEEEIAEDKTAYFADGALYRFGFRQNVPEGRVRVVVDVPTSVPYKELLHYLPALSVSRTEADGVRHIVYEATALRAHHDSDIDLTTNNPDTPMLEFSTGASWEAVAKSYAAMTDPQAVLAEAQAALPPGLPTERLARIRAIVKQLHHEVRYTGVEFGAARLTPVRPAEVIQRHYGDCKDKANLLVAMLRAANIHASLALLSAGPGRDVVPDLPGINRFDHAIVYVPQEGQSPAIWIDATADTFAVGTLPYGDQGRNALIIAPGTKSLTRTPDPKPVDSVLVETRTFKLAEFGPSQVEETSETHGYIDATYRADFGGPETPKIHEDLENYAKRAFLAKKLTAIEHGDGTDFEHTFHLTLKADGARRGSTSLIDGLVVIFPTGTLDSLPKWFGQKPPVIGPDTSADQKRHMELAEKSRPQDFTVRPFIYEQHTHVLVPPGFVARALPADKTTPIGTATLTETYRATPDAVDVTFKFDSGPSTLSADQALAMRTAVLELEKRDYVGVFFDQAGAKALTNGHIREALAIDRKLIAANPTDGLHHLQLSHALLEAGIGSEAQLEAKRGTELAPALAPGFTAYGWSLEHDALGERFGKGYDRAGALAAYKRAMELDPEDTNPRFSYAILCEFDANGTRYNKGADMAEAIKTYKDLIERNKAKGDDEVSQYRENLLYALLYSRQFAELDTTLGTLPFTDTHRALAVASASLQHGAPAGIAQAEKGNTSTAERNKILRSAGAYVANLRQYATAATLIETGMPGAPDAAAEARQVENYKGLKETAIEPLPATDPAAPMKGMLIGTMTGTLTRAQAENFLSHHAYADDAGLERDVDKNLALSGYLRPIAEKSDMTETVLLDMTGGSTTFTTKGDDATGYEGISQESGGEPTHFFVVKEDGQYRIVCDENDWVQVGQYVLWALDHGKPATAKKLLDWKRDLTHKGGGDDPYSGPLMPRFWTVGSSKPGADSPQAMRLAAISLMSGYMSAKPYLREIQAARDKATGQRQTDLDLMLAYVAMGAEDPATGMPPAMRLLDQEPDSTIALGLVGRGYAFKGDAAGWLAVVQPRLAKKPADRDLLDEQTRAYSLAKNWKAAKDSQRKVLDSGKATANDYNNYAWLGLFHDDLGDDITKAAQQSVQMNKNSGFGELHTLACVYAAQGKTTEAREVLKQAIYANNEAEPNSAVWYALGLIYEQYGANDAALAAYLKVQAHELDDHTYIDPTATYVLAQQRLTALEASGDKGQGR